MTDAALRWKALGISVASEGSVAIITYDRPNAPVNVLSSAVGAAFAELFTFIEHNTSYVAAVLASGKPDTWIAGADIDELAALKTPLAGEELSRGAHVVMHQIERMHKPVVAAIHGAALGGGLETALACRHRIVTDHRKTVLALPEVQLGLIPGAGGTQRLPQLVGLQAALDMMLTGRNIRAKKALQMGLVHEVVHPAILRRVAVDRALSLARGEKLPLKERAHGAARFLLEENPLGRAVVFRKARETVLEKTKGHYPAPLAVIDVVHKGFSDGATAGYAEEARRFGDLAVSAVSRELVYLFFATTALKRDSGIARRSRSRSQTGAQAWYPWRRIHGCGNSVSCRPARNTGSSQGRLPRSVGQGVCRRTRRGARAPAQATDHAQRTRQHVVAAWTDA